MPSTNAPRNIATTAGNISLETEIIDRQRRRRGIPIVEVRVTILPGTVKAPNILFCLAYTILIAYTQGVPVFGVH